MEALREKALAFASGLDDRALELLKLDLVRQGRLWGIFRERRYEGIGLERCDLGGRLVFRLTNETGEMELSVAPCEYELFECGLRASSIAASQPLLVDRRWAQHALRRIHKEGVLPL